MKKIQTTRSGQRGKSQVNTPNVVPHDISRPNPWGKTPFTLGPLKVVLHDIPTPKPTELDADQAGTRAKSFYTTFSKGLKTCCTTFLGEFYKYANRTANKDHFSFF